MKFSEVVAEPLVATIVAVVEPVGVPPLVPPPPPLLLLVPPQLAISMMPAVARISRAKDAPERRRLLGVLRSAKMLMPRMASSDAAAA